jgi:hypothetical protein
MRWTLSFNLDVMGPLSVGIDGHLACISCSGESEICRDERRTCPIEQRRWKSAVPQMRHVSNGFKQEPLKKIILAASLLNFHSSWYFEFAAGKDFQGRFDFSYQSQIRADFL